MYIIEVVATIDTDKTAMEVVAPVAGVLRAHLASDGATVVAKQKLYTLEIGAEGRFIIIQCSPNDELAKSSPP